MKFYFMKFVVIKRKTYSIDKTETRDEVTF